MMNQYLARYVDQQRSLGFKFRVQHILLRGYVAFAVNRRGVRMPIGAGVTLFESKNQDVS